MTLHQSTFAHLQPTDEQIALMEQMRQYSAVYAAALDRLLPDGPDKDFIIRNHRTNAMWANVAITREVDGTPRA